MFKTRGCISLVASLIINECINAWMQLHATGLYILAWQSSSPDVWPMVRKHLSCASQWGRSIKRTRDRRELTRWILSRCHRDRNTQLLTAITVWWTRGVRAIQTSPQSSYCSTQTSLVVESYNNTDQLVERRVLRIILLFLHSANEPVTKPKEKIICLN